MNAAKINKNQKSTIFRKRVTRGQVLMIDNDPFMVASFEDREGDHLGYGLIDLTTGNRWTKPVLPGADGKVYVSDLVDSDSPYVVELLDPGTEIVLTVGGPI